MVQIERNRMFAKSANFTTINNLVCVHPCLRYRTLPALRLSRDTILIRVLFLRHKLEVSHKLEVNQRFEL